jgi:CobQ-like glutamine amidotransferase family enzyme
MTEPGGTVHLGADLLDLATCPGRRRATGQITTHCHLPGVGQLCGFENHRGATTLGPGLRPLGRVLTGIGNTGNHGPRIGHRTGRGDEGVLTASSGHRRTGPAVGFQARNTWSAH